MCVMYMLLLTSVGREFKVILWKKAMKKRSYQWILKQMMCQYVNVIIPFLTADQVIIVIFRVFTGAQLACNRL